MGAGSDIAQALVGKRSLCQNIWAPLLFDPQHRGASTLTAECRSEADGLGSRAGWSVSRAGLRHRANARGKEG
jgi:hypothetical protein